MFDTLLGLSFAASIVMIAICFIMVVDNRVEKRELVKTRSAECSERVHPLKYQLKFNDCHSASEDGSWKYEFTFED